VVIIIITMFV